MKSTTQKAIVLRLLIENRGDYVSAPLLARKSHAGALNRRLQELRKDGFAIENKLQKISGVTHSSYKLI